jgi:hypothetical protein
MIKSQTNAELIGTFVTLNDEERQQFLKENFPSRVNLMSPISEKDTLYERTVSEAS